jgi:hypothetical protein
LRPTTSAADKLQLTLLAFVLSACIAGVVKIVAIWAARQSFRRQLLNLAAQLGDAQSPPTPVAPVSLK